jgi:hypothetical protein
MSSFPGASTEGSTPLGAVFMCLMPFHILAGYLFFTRRQFQPIKARSPTLVLVTGGVSAVFLSSFLSHFSDTLAL